MTTEREIKNNSDDISLKEVVNKFGEWWNYLSAKWLVIVAVLVLGAVIGFGYGLLSKRVYTASTTFVLEDEKAGSGGLGNLAGLASMAGVDIGSGGGGIFQGENILQLYRSRTMIEKTLFKSTAVAAKKELLIERFIKDNKWREKWDDKPKLYGFDFSLNVSSDPIRQRLKDSVIREVVEEINKKYLSVAKPDKKLSIIQVDVAAKDEIFAKVFNDELVKNVNEFYIATKTKKALQNIAILEDKRDSVRKVMNGAIYTAVSVADATPNLNLTRQVQRIAPAQKAQFSAETNKQVLGELIKNLEMSKMALLKETPLIQVIDQPIYPLSWTNVSKIKASLYTSFFFGFLCVMVLIIKKILSDLSRN